MKKHDMSVLFSSKDDEHGTPDVLFNKLCHVVWFGPFTLDPASTEENSKCKKFHTLADDGLSKSWAGENVFVNPPYTKRQVALWVKKAYEEASNNPYTSVTLLLPSRTDTKWFHDYCMKATTILFIKGRIKFVGNTNSAPFPSMVVHFRHGSIDKGFPKVEALTQNED